MDALEDLCEEGDPNGEKRKADLGDEKVEVSFAIKKRSEFYFSGPNFKEETK